MLTAVICTAHMASGASDKQLIDSNSAKCDNDEMIRSEQKTSLMKVFAASATILAWAFSTQSVSAQGGYNSIRSVHSGRCMDVAGANRNNLANVVQWDCHSRPNQLFLLAPAPGGNYRIIAAHSRKCLDVSGVSRDNGANLLQFDCHSGPNQQFRLERTGDGSFLVRPIHSNKCLDVEGWSRDNGGNIQQWDCHGGANQRWWLQQR